MNTFRLFTFVWVSALSVLVLSVFAHDNVIAEKNDSQQITLQYALQSDDYKVILVTVNGKVCTSIRLKEASRDRTKGEPDLPQIAQAIAIPDKGKMKLEIVDAQFTVQSGHTIVPSKGSLSRRVNPADIPYTFGPVYSDDAWFPRQCAYLGNSPYIAGEYRGLVVYFQPFQYHPETNSLRIYTKITVTVSSTLEQGMNEKRRRGKQKPFSEFKLITSKNYLGPKILHHSDAEADSMSVSDEGTMLIIAHNSYLQALEPLVDWKNKRGVKTELVDVATIGTTTEEIQAYVKDYYYDESHNLRYLMLVGNVSQLPPMRNYPVVDVGYTENAPADNMYGMIEGDDAYMEVYVGRLFGFSINDIEAQVEKILYAERKYSSSDTWLAKAVGTNDPSESDDKDCMDYIIDNLEGYNFSFVDRFTREGDPDMITAVNNGIATHFNASHGDVNFIQPFKTSDVSKMNNENRYPYSFISACLPGKFDGNNGCLATALLCKEKGGYVGAFMATIEQNWYEPYAAVKGQSDILCEKSNHDTRRIYGDVAINGAYRMVEEYPHFGPEELRCWELFGDPNLHIYTDIPKPISINHPGEVITGSQDIVISGTENATVCLYSKHMEIQKVRNLTDGEATFSVSINGDPGDTVYVTGTMFNHETYEGKILVGTKTSISEGATIGVRNFEVYIAQSQLCYRIPDAVGAGNTMDVTFRLFTPQGRLIKHLSAQKGPGRFAMNLHRITRNCAKGIYFASMTIGNYSKVVNVVLK